MLVELHSEDFSRVRPLLGEISYNLVVPSILEGNTLGKLFVCNEEKPDSVIVWNCNDTVLIGGDPGEESKGEYGEFLEKYLIPAAGEKGIPVLNFYSTGKAKRCLRDLLGDLEPKPILRYLFRLNPSGFGPSTLESDSAVRITAELLESSLENIDHLTGWILSFWPNLDSFLENSLGFCAVEDSKIVSLCIGVYRSKNHIELGAETLKGFKRLGFGRKVALACVKESCSKGLIVDWQCEASNNPSVLIAKRLGFQEVLQYTISQISI